MMLDDLIGNGSCEDTIDDDDDDDDTEGGG